MSPKTCKDIDAAVRYIDFLCEEDTIFTLNYGFEGKHIQIKNGVPVPIDIDFNAKTTAFTKNDLNLCINGFILDGTEAGNEVNRMSDPEYADVAILYRTKALSGVGLPQILFNKELDSATKYQPQIDKLYDYYFIKLILSENTDVFNATYDEFIKELKTNGIDEIIAERTEQYEQNAY